LQDACSIEREPSTHNYLPGNKNDAVPLFVGFLGFYKNLMCSYYLRGNLAISLAAEYYCIPDPKTLTMGVTASWIRNDQAQRYGLAVILDNLKLRNDLLAWCALTRELLPSIEAILSGSAKNS